MYHLSHVCCTLVPEIRIRPEMLGVFWLSLILTCYMCDLQLHSTEQQGRLELTRVCRADY